jgi:hypothetical protein
MISKKINAILLATVIASASAYAAEVQQTEQQDTAQTSVIWYKKRSTHLVAAAAATVIGVYALAVRKNKIAGPVAWATTLFYGCKNAQEVKNVDEVKDTDQKQDQDNKSHSVTSEDPKNPSVDLDQQKTENNQSATTDDVTSNDLPTTAAPLHIKAQQYAENALSSIKEWITVGLINEDSLQN